MSGHLKTVQCRTVPILCCKHHCENLFSFSWCNIKPYILFWMNVLVFVINTTTNSRVRHKSLIIVRRFVCLLQASMCREIRNASFLCVPSVTDRICFHFHDAIWAPHTLHTFLWMCLCLWSHNKLKGQAWDTNYSKLFSYHVCCRLLRIVRLGRVSQLSHAV